DDEIDDDEIDDDEAESADDVEPVGPEPSLPAAATGSTAPGRRVIVIEEDDRPDSVYLDAEQEQQFKDRRDVSDDSGERSTIVIADLDEHGMGEPPLARSRGAGIDPRIRARRISVRRAEGRRRLVWVGVAAAVALLAVAVIAVFASTIFDVREVEVQGAVYTDPDLLQSVIDDLMGEPVLLVDTQRAEERLESVPWVENARVSTSFPHRVVIDLRERRPVAAFQGADGEYRVIDVQSRVLEVIVNQPADYMLITGSHPDTARGQFAGAPYAAAAELVLSLPTEISAITSTVGVDAVTGTLTMVLAGPGIGGSDEAGVEVRLGDANDLDEKLARLLRQVRSGLDGVCGLDVSTAVAGVVRC
ncbi:MAG: FtsQ-type POTRA domain-containing protein, partial [Actinomycetota bacterium]|nr:FtsQ-type POTRA domain-containing protein [Actinomycetota bacterium]